MTSFIKTDANYKKRKQKAMKGVFPKYAWDINQTCIKKDTAIKEPNK